MENYGERVRQIRKEMGVSQSKFGQQLGLATMVVSRIESNETGLKAPILAKLDDIGVNISWLLSGKGNMLKKNPSKESSMEDSNAQIGRAHV